jgi:hypothetical protein
MTQTCRKQESPRYRFVFDKVPTMRVNRYGGSCEFYSSPRSYGQVLDCIYEMTLDLVDANADEPEKAIEQVLSDEGWRILPTHKKAVLDRVRLMAFNKT